MAMARIFFALMAVFVLVLNTAVPCVQAQAFPPAPAPSSDGASIDQGIAYVLMLLALALTYLIH